MAHGVDSQWEHSYFSIE